MSPIRMTDLERKPKDFGGIGNFYRCRLQILANLSGKHFGWNGKATPMVGRGPGRGGNPKGGEHSWMDEREIER